MPPRGALRAFVSFNDSLGRRSFADVEVRPAAVGAAELPRRIGHELAETRGDLRVPHHPLEADREVVVVRIRRVEVDGVLRGVDRVYLEPTLVRRAPRARL